ncbi:zf-HC2 domain-containing protein [Actinopolymorpha singaporensis]|uniref:Putative zinc-finger n=1 Tax=Actinopolymorpha singaporensis TaxID=117157 RepID=A0A1H1N4U3_9ACTN|nr:zf-HC2 domain-containing protein [Actinopolymorpha singaporensis]SDR93888.1 Putative zinc-finger [Actinopolymorpha singaporensis]
MTAGPHVDDDTLAAAHAGLLSDAEAARIDAHLAGCAACSAAADAHAELEHLLRESAAIPTQMPSAVAERMESALAAEARARADGRPGVTPLSAARDRAGRRSGWRRPSRLLAVAAGVAVLAAGAGVAGNLLDERDVPVAGGSHTTAPRTPSPSTASPSPRPVPPGSYAFTAQAAGTNFSAARFGSEVGAVVAAGTPKPPGKPFGPRSNNGLAPDPSRCVDRVLDAAGAGGTLLDTVGARFGGTPVTVALVRTSGGSSGVPEVRAYAIAGCPSQDAHVVGTAQVPVR